MFILKMKKHLMTFVFMSLTVIASQAQGVLDLPEFNSGKAIWFVRAGASFSGVTGSGVDDLERSWEKNKYDGNFSRKFGGNLMIGFNKSFGHSPVYWGMELGAGMRGYKTEAEKSNSGSVPSAGRYSYYSITTDTNELNVFNAQISPFNIGYKHLFNDMLAVDVHVGGFASYDFAGEFESRYTYNMSSTSQHGGSNQSKDDGGSTKISDIDGYRSYDFGVIAGAGVWLGHFNLDFTWQRGFVSMFDGDNELFNNSLQLRLGYAF